MADVIANVTDGIAKWDEMFLIMTDDVAIEAHGLATLGELLFYFIFSSEMVNTTSSHM